MIAPRRSRSGSLAAVAAVAMVPLLSVTGLGVDYARVTLVRQELQKALDAGALAAARYLENIPGDSTAHRETLQADSDAKVIADGAAYFWANFAVSPTAGATIEDGPTVKIETSQRLALTISATAKVDLYFAGLLGVPSFRVTAASNAERYTRGIEIVLALDLSRSMQAGKRIQRLREGALDLVDIVFRRQEYIPKRSDCFWFKDMAAPEGRSRACADNDFGVWMGIVPFAGTVNVGPSARKAKIDIVSEGDLPAPAEFGVNHRGERANFWKGCVRARPSLGSGDAKIELEGTHALEHPGRGSYAFKPYFWPPTPETIDVDGKLYAGANFWRKTHVQEIKDQATPPKIIQPFIPATTEEWPIRFGDNRYAYFRDSTGVTRDYRSGARFENALSEDAIGWGSGAEAGPNRGCTYPLMPLQPSASTAREIIRNLQPTAGNGTHINLGMAWSWRVLAQTWAPIWRNHKRLAWEAPNPDAPTTRQSTWYINENLLSKGADGSPKSFAKHGVEDFSRQFQKIVVLFTDGKNEIGTGVDRFEGASAQSCCYSAYGSWWSDLKNDPDLAGDPVKGLNDLTRNVCAAMKARDITIYVVHLFDFAIFPKDDVGKAKENELRSMLDQRGCASTPDHYINIKDEQDLRRVFRDIASALTNLRLLREPQS
jgi:Flp pilus assembly protein TadG